MLQELDENIEGLSAQVEYLQENINEHQSDIVEMMDGRESGDTIDLQVTTYIVRSESCDRHTDFVWLNIVVTRQTNFTTTLSTNLDGCYHYNINK